MDFGLAAARRPGMTGYGLLLRCHLWAATSCMAKTSSKRTVIYEPSCVRCAPARILDGLAMRDVIYDIYVWTRAINSVSSVP
jgi:hypothetical protein